MKEVVPGVYMMEGLLGANSYLLVSNSGTVLVDSGVRADADRINAQVSQAGYAGSVKSIVLTHFHGDHVGGAKKLADLWKAQVMAYQADAPFISMPGSIPAFSSFKQLVNWVGANLVFRSQAVKVDLVLADGDKIDALDGYVVVHTPGHTYGSLSLYHPEKQVLLCGDALFNINPATKKPGLQLPLRRISLDNAQALHSVHKLSRLPIKVICFGHGEPILECAGEQVRALLAQYPASNP